MRVYIETYGCALNKADTSLMKALLQKCGCEVVSSIEDADVIIVNTCTVRLDTEQRILKRLKKLKEIAKKTNAKLVIAGCMVSAQPYTLHKLVPEASLISPQNIHNICEVVWSRETKFLIKGERDTSKLPLHIEGSIAVIPIAEGCLGNCAYCITKIARRRLRSYPPQLIVDAVRKAVESGAVEIDLTAQDTASYGLDLGPEGPRLPDLISEILRRVSGNYFIRVGMANPDTLEPILDDLIEVLKEPRVFKYVHIPLQSASNHVLKVMRRKYTFEEFKYIIRRLRSRIPEVTIATDIIVGHPGEDKEAFRTTLEAVRELMFDKVHLAQYTPRPRTEAAAMPQVPDPVKKRRSTILAKLIEKVGLTVNKQYVGSYAEAVLTHLSFRGSVIGRLFNYKPVVLIDADPNLIGSQMHVLIQDATFYDLRGSLIHVSTIKNIRKHINSA